jgi:hypothetical protein
MTDPGDACLGPMQYAQISQAPFQLCWVLATLNLIPVPRCQPPAAVISCGRMAIVGDACIRYGRLPHPTGLCGSLKSTLGL